MTKDAKKILTPEDDLFGRVAVFNKLVNLNQIVECARLISAEAVAGRPRRSLASVLITKGYLSAEKARAVQEALEKRAAAVEGMAEPAAEGQPPEPKPMSKEAPAGDSRIMVAVEPQAGPQDERFEILEDEGEGFATLKAKCYNLYPPDRPGFEAACQQLLETGRPRLFVDLRGVQKVASLIIGELARANREALGANQQLILQAGDKMARTVRMILGDTIKTIA